MYLKKRSTAEDVIDDEVIKYKEERKKKKEDEQEVKEAIEIAKTKRNREEISVDSDGESNFDDMDVSITSRGGRGSRRGRRGRGSESGVTRGTRGGRGRGAKNKEPVVNDSQRSMMESFTSSGRSRALNGGKKSKFE